MPDDDPEASEQVVPNQAKSARRHARTLGRAILKVILALAVIRRMSGARTRVPTTNREENHRAAIVAVGNYGLATTAAVTAVLVLALTVFYPNTGHADTWQFGTGAILLLLSLIAGITVLGTQIEMLDAGNLKLGDPTLLTVITIHLALAAAGLIFMSLFASHYLKHDMEKPADCSTIIATPSTVPAHSTPTSSLSPTCPASP
ncbi:hypothetical protein C8250_028880 [Streptomyces sp. So13.3]|uniref:hypothetical protein n=1 Tax=Streptomyces sp. So13.3 TaxID=2136173 RepID=UPI0011072C7F|nr:hypothetical protein [Streptomyces sp. So13.3]QNA75368.1 hypothetical protein C8250_028880 [Streptomyces sp. So13.3]